MARPFENTDHVEDLFVIPGAVTLPKNEKPKPSAKEVFDAAFELDNDFVGLYEIGKKAVNGFTSGASGKRTPVESSDPNFDQFAGLEGTQYADPAFVNMFANAVNEQEVENIKKAIDKRIKLDETIREGGTLGGIAELVSGFSSPLTILPIGAGYKGAKVGRSLLDIALESAAAGALDAAISETILHTAQGGTRSASESFFAVGASSLFGSVLGVGVSKFADGVLTKTGKTLDEVAEDGEKQLFLPGGKDPLEQGFIEADLTTPKAQIEKELTAKLENTTEFEVSKLTDAIQVFQQGAEPSVAADGLVRAAGSLEPEDFVKSIAGLTQEQINTIGRLIGC